VRASRRLDAATVEATIAAGLAILIAHRHETVTSMLGRLRRHPAGLLVLCAAIGAALGHVLLDDQGGTP